MAFPQDPRCYGWWPEDNANHDRRSNIQISQAPPPGSNSTNLTTKADLRRTGIQSGSLTRTEQNEHAKRRREAFQPMGPACEEYLVSIGGDPKQCDKLQKD